MERFEKRKKIENSYLWILIFTIIFNITIIPLGFIYFTGFWYIFIPLIIFIDFMFYLYYQSLKAKGFDACEIEPYASDLSHDSYESIINKLEKLVEKEFNKLDDDTSYLFVKMYNINFRILVMKIDDINKASFHKRKKLANKQINRKIEIRPKGSMLDTNRYMRINLVVTNPLNDFSNKLVHQNAADLMKRVESILNVVISLDDNKMYIPASFGSATSTNYYQAFKLLYKALINK